MIETRNIRTYIIALTCMSALAVSGCSTAGKVLRIGDDPTKNAGPCPEAFALYEASRLVKVEGAESYSNVSYTAEITKVRSLCRYYDDKPIDADLTLDISFGRGPAAQGRQATYNYFVAVTRKNIEVIEKKVFPITVTFPEGVNIMEATEKLAKIIIPRATDTTSGANFEIIVGFDLTPEQIAFNSDGKRFRVSAGQN